MPRKKIERILAILDYETDPFLYGRIPAPFVCGFYTSDKYLEFWGDDCVKQLIDYLSDCDETYLIYAHNGGKFDYFFMLEYLENPLKIISGRIAKCRIGRHECRDSYSILPIPLAAYAKDTFDYALMEKDVRHAHKAKISVYLKSDCVYLYELVSKFRKRFGDILTIGGAAINELRKYHPFENQYKSHDDTFRKYYFGGRVEYFEAGVLKGKWKIFDVNSMYPSVMRNCLHPTGRQYKVIDSPKISALGIMKGAPFYFAEIKCNQHGAFPARVKGESLTFDLPSGEFFVTSHELQAALETGRVSNLTVARIYVPYEVLKFDDFVDVFMAEKISAKKSGDKVSEIFSKLILNSSYGKFGTNSENYFDFHIQAPEGDSPAGDTWEIYLHHETGVNVWRRPTLSMQFFDVATAASITGAARAVLMRALGVAKRAVYCDTDSIICEALRLPKSDTALGSWKLEASGDTLAIAGKKLYALREKGKPVKKASKGAVLSDAEIFRVAKGETVSWQKHAPSFSFANGVKFIDRKIQSRIR